MPPRMLPSICNRFQVNFGKVSLYPEVTDLRSWNFVMWYVWSRPSLCCNFFSSKRLLGWGRYSGILISEVWSPLDLSTPIEAAFYHISTTSCLQMFVWCLMLCLVNFAAERTYWLHKSCWRAQPQHFQCRGAVIFEAFTGTTICLWRWNLGHFFIRKHHTTLSVRAITNHLDYVPWGTAVAVWQMNCRCMLSLL